MTPLPPCMRKLPMYLDYNPPKSMRRPMLAAVLAYSAGRMSATGVIRCVYSTRISRLVQSNPPPRQLSDRLASASNGHMSALNVLFWPRLGRALGADGEYAAVHLHLAGEVEAASLVRGDGELDGLAQR